MKCNNCKNGIWCDIWAQIKCITKGRRLQPDEDVSECKDFQKRGTDEKKPECQCDDCLTTRGYER